MVRRVLGRQWRAWRGTRSVFSTTLLVVGAVLVMAGGVAGSLYGTVFSADRFAGTAVKAIQHPAVKAKIENELVNQVIAQRPELLAGRPIVQTVVDAAIVSKPFQTILTTAFLETHRTFFGTDQPTLMLDISDGAQVILGGLKAYDPKLAASVPGGRERHRDAG
jgi:hypothetical protein